MTVLAILAIATVAGSATGGTNRAGAVGITHMEDSVIVLAIDDGSISYGNVSWTLFAMDFSKFSIKIDDKSLTNGSVIGVQVVNTTSFLVGPHRYTVTIGIYEFAWNVLVINETAEHYVEHTILPQGKTVEISTLALVWMTIKTHAITMAFFFLPFPLVFIWVVKRKEMEARQIV